MLNFSVSPSIRKSSSAAIVYGLSHVPHTMPRSLLPTFLMMKILLRRADAESEPHADDVFLGQLRLPRTRLNIGKPVRAVRVPAGGVARHWWTILRKHRHLHRNGIRSVRIFDQHTLELAAAGRAARAGDDQAPLAELRDRLVLVRRAAVRLHMGDLERDAVGSERPIDERQRRRIGAIRAVDAPDRRAANREFVGVRLAAVRSPAAAIIIRVLTGCRARERQHGDQHHHVFHECLPT